MPQVAETRPLRREEAMRILRAHEGEIRSRGVLSLALVGSTARDEAGAASDVDVLVAVDRGRRFSLVEFVGLQQYLSRLMGRPVDLIERDALDRPRLREAVLRDAVEVIA